MTTADVPRDGHMHPIDPDPRDQGEESPLARLGRDMRACATLHVPGVTDRDTVTARLHAIIVTMPPPDGEPELCGVPHVEDIGIWQTPHTGRAALRREIARLAVQHRRPVVIIQGYQHVGSCPDAAPEQTP